MNDRPDVSILIVGYNSQDFLPACLAALARATAEVSCELLFIDNGDRQTEALVEHLWPLARVVPGQGNIGFAAANNLLGRKAKGRWLLLLNPDTEIEHDAVTALVTAARSHPDFGILGGMTVISRKSGKLLPPLDPPGPAMAIRGMLGRARSQWALDSQNEVVPAEMASGGFLLVEHSLWQRLDGFDEQFFLYGEDCDLCTRSRAIGAGVGLVPKAKAFHAIGSGAAYSSQRLAYQMQGNATYVRKHYRKPAAAMVLLLLWLSICVRLLGAMLFQIGNERYHSMFRGYLALAFTPQIWVKGYQRNREVAKSS